MSGTNPPDDDRLYQVLADYLEALDHGSSPDRASLLASHPNLAGPLAEYFAASDEVRAHATDLSPHTPLPPLRFSAYGLLEEIGRGGMGVVYRARQKTPDRVVAVKMIRPGLWATPADVRRFRTEAESAARLDHPNIVPVHEIGERDGRLFFSMKYCAGGSLAQMAAGGRPAEDVRGVAVLVAAVARAVHHAHQRGVLHRDLKPSNILLDEAGRPYVADFGLAKLADRDADLTVTGAVLGTPGYLAPEMVPACPGARAEPAPVATTAVDVYGLGTVLYFLLTGRPPFRGQTLADTLAQAQSHDPASPRQLNPAVDRDLAAVCLRCLEKQPARRYASAEALADDLGRWLSGLPTVARPVGRLTRLRRWAWGNPVSTGLAALVALSVGVGVGALVVSYRAVVAEREATLRSQRETAEYAEQSRARAYPGDVHLAHGLWQRGEVGECRVILDRYLPGEGRADLRGWEWHYLDALLRAGPREVSRFRGRGVAFHAAFSPDGATVASAWEGGNIQLSDARTGAAVRAAIWAHGKDVNWVAFVGDGSRLVSAGEDGFIRLWDVKTGAPLNQKEDQTGAVECVAVSPDGGWLVSGGADGVLRVRSLPELELLHERAGHAGNIEGVALSPDGRLAASASYDGTVRLWELAVDGPRYRWAIELGGQVFAVAFSPDGTRLGAGRVESEAVELEVATGKVLGRNTTSAGKNRGVAYAPGAANALLVVGDDGRLRAWDANRNEWQCAAPAHSNTAWSVACSPDGRSAVTAGSDSTVRVWTLAPGPVRPLGAARGGVSYLRPHARGVAVQSSPDGGWPAGERPWTVRFDGDDPAEPPLSFTGAAHPAAAVSADGRAVAFARGDGSVAVRERGWAAARRVADPLPPSADGKGPPVVHASDLCFLPGGRLAASYIDGTFAVLPLGGGSPAYRTRLADEQPGVLAAIPGLGVGVASAPRFSFPRFRLLDPDRGDWAAAEYRAPSAVMAFAVSPAGGRAALGHGNGGIKVIALPPGGEEMSLFGHAAGVTAVAYSPDGKTIASACADGVVRLWHAATGQELYVLEGRGRAVTSLAFTADGRLLVAGAALPDGHTVTVHDAGQPPG